MRSSTPPVSTQFISADHTTIDDSQFPENHLLAQITNKMSSLAFTPSQIKLGFRGRSLSKKKAKKIAATSTKNLTDT